MFTSSEIITSNIFPTRGAWLVQHSEGKITLHSSEELARGAVDRVGGTLPRWYGIDEPLQFTFVVNSESSKSPRVTEVSETKSPPSGVHLCHAPGGDYLTVVVVAEDIVEAADEALELFNKHIAGSAQ